MDAKLAEVMVKTWQNIKSQALGPSHSLEKLSEVCMHRTYGLKCYML